MRDAPVGQKAAPLRLLDRRAPSFRVGDSAPMTLLERYFVRRALRATRKAAQMQARSYVAMNRAATSAIARLGDDHKLAADTRTKPWRWVLER